MNHGSLRINPFLLSVLTLASAAALTPACSSEDTPPSDAPGSGGSAGQAATGGASGSSGKAGGATGGAMPNAGMGGSNLSGAGGSVAGSGGGMPQGGSAGSGFGKGGSAGSATAGSAGSLAGGGGSGAGGSSSGACTFTVNQSLSEKIPTVGIVEWSSDLPGLDSASIEFGLDTTYGMTAPVDLAEPMRRTLLLGMKPSKTYHFRVVAGAGATQCASQDFMLTTGPVPNSLARPEIETTDASKLYGGFLISARWGVNNGGPAFILDKDGEAVWWYPGMNVDDVIRARMSYDGKSMWLRNTAQTNGIGAVRRVTMDGLTEERWSLPNTTHDLAVIPDGTVGLVAHAGDVERDCDEILLFDPETEVLTPIFNAQEAHGSSDCHINYLAYYQPDDTFVFSDYTTSNLVKITRQGELVWVLNGMQSSFTGSDWEHQHGVHLLAADRLLVFSNGNMGSPSYVLEYLLNLGSMTATETWRYDGDLSTPFGGDVQRLANGNTMIAYSSSGVLHEVAADGTLLQSMTWPIGNTISYIEKRKSLYGGPPPKLTTALE